ncbi:MAG: MFS transporter, partial [Bacteroidota bacterium]
AVIWEMLLQYKMGFAKQTVTCFSRTKQALKEPKKQIKTRQVLYLSLAYLCMDYVFYMFIFWFFIYLIDFRGFEILNGGLISIFPFAVGAVGGIIGGVLLDRLSRRLGIEKASRVLAFSALSSAGVLLTLGAYVAHANLAIFLLSICLGLCQSTETLFWTGASTIGGRNSGTVTGILNTGGNLGGLLCTYTVPFIKNYLGWGGALASGSIMAVIAAILWCNIRIQAND